MGYCCIYSRKCYFCSPLILTKEPPGEKILIQDKALAIVKGRRFQIQQGILLYTDLP